MIKSSLQVVKVSAIMAVLTNIFNVVTFNLYPQYLQKEKVSITVMENEFMTDLVNIKYIAFYLLLWIVISGIYMLLAKLNVQKIYRIIIWFVLLVALIIGTTSIGYMIHLLGHVLFVIFSVVTFVTFYFLIENEIFKSEYY